MDIASLIGFLGAVGMIIGAMISGGGVGPFIDIPSPYRFWWYILFCYVHNPATNFPWQFRCYGKSFYATSKKTGRCNNA